MKATGKNKAPATGQRSIAAFFKPSAGAVQQKRPAPSAPSKDDAGDATAAEQAEGGSPHQEEVVEPSAKRSRQAYLVPSGSPQQARHPPSSSAGAAAGRSPVAALADIGEYIIPARDAGRHARAQAKLARPEVYDPAAAAGPALAAAGPSTGAGRGKKAAAGAVKYTPLEEQVVALKAQHPGVLLVVEVGYKMRFFGEDAQVAASVLRCYCYPDHNFLTASIPVPRLPVHVRRLVQAGYKVGVVRQVESAAIKAAGDNKYAPFTRQLTALYTPATLDAGEKADKAGEEGTQGMFSEVEASLAASYADSARYLLLLAEEGAGSTAAAGDPTASGGMTAAATEGEVGVLAVEISSGDLAYTVCAPVSGSSTAAASNAAAAGTDPTSSMGSLEAALLMVSPVEIVLVGPVSPATQRLIDAYKAGATGGADSTSSRPVRLERLPRSSYLSKADMQLLADFYGCSLGDSCPPGQGGSSTDVGTSTQAAPGAAAAAAAADGVADSPAAREVLQLPTLVLRAVAGAVEYLTAFGLTAVLQQGSFRHLAAVEAMQLTSNTLRQLEVLRNQAGALEGSLLQLLDRTCTASGGAMLKRWLGAPLVQQVLLLQRQDAVQELLQGSSGPLSVLAPWLGALTLDPQRTLGRVTARTARPAEAAALLHSLAQAAADLACTSGDAAGGPGSSAGSSVAEAAVQQQVTSPLLRSLLTSVVQPAVAGTARQLLQLLDADAAASNDMVAVFRSKEAFADVYACKEAVKAAEAHLQALLPKLAAAAGVRSCSYVTIQNQGTYLVELPADFARVPAGWEKVCSTKKVARFHPPEVKAGMTALAIAQETLQATCSTAWGRYLGQVSAHHALLWQATSAIAQLDALQSLAAVAGSEGYCRPQLLPDSDPPQLHIMSGRHPVLDQRLSTGAVPNDVELSWAGQRGCVVTGPNMGGKSVYTRMAGCIALLAQVGSWVPAESVTMTVLDGIYTRMGASDNILQGRSTFMEELGDAAAILQRATPRSLVILDELGRGTATHDGVAIATATLAHLLQTTQCLTLFVTHYPSVAAEAAHLGDPMAQAGAAEARAAVAARAGAPQSGGGRLNEPGASQRQQQQQQVPVVPFQVGVYHMAYLRDGPPSAAGAEAAVAATPPAVATAAGGGGGEGTGAAAAAGPDATTASSAGAAAAAAAPEAATIVFLYKLVEGAADRSFGLNVAQMAGLPAPVVHRAAAVARELQHQNEQASGVLSQHTTTSQDVAGQGGAAAEHGMLGNDTPPAAALNPFGQQQPPLGPQEQQQLSRLVRCLLEVRKERSMATGGPLVSGSQRVLELWEQCR